MKQLGQLPILPVIIAGALGVGLAFSMYLNWSQYQRAQDDKRQLNGTISDLRYQVAQDQANASSPKPTSAASATPTPSASPTPTTGAVAGAQALAITPMGVKLTPSDPLSDLEYKSIPSQTAGAVVVGFNSPALTTKYAKCTEIGQLVRRPLSQRPPSGNIYLTTLGSYKYYYFYPSADATCDTSPQGKADVAAAENALLNTILKTLTQ